MKRLILFIFACVAAFLSPSWFAFADNGNSKTVPLKKEKRHEKDVPPDKFGHRKPTAPVLCVIGEFGLTIDDSENPQIYLYEAYNEDGFCVASYSSEVDFIEFIINTNRENVELRFYTDNFIYSGWWIQ